MKYRKFSAEKYVLIVITATFVFQNAAYTVEAAAYDGDAEENKAGKWFMYWGAANLHADLKESEAKIDRELNQTLGRLISGWKKPVTLKDWSESFLLWDGHIGIGRELSPKWSWFLGTGGTAGTVRNAERYALPIPLRVEADFSRRLMFLVTGLDFYPWGKPRLECKPGGNKLIESLRATRPFAEIATSYTRLKTVADVDVRLFGALSLLKRYEETDYDLFHISPRVGLEAPLSKSNSILVQAGYLFFNQHPDEFNNFSLYVFHKHRF